MENEKNPLLEIIENISKNLNNNSSDISTNTTNNNFTSKNENSGFNILDIINNLGTNNLNQKTNQNNGFDLSNILKMQKIISAFNEEDPRKNLLASIKPFLRKSRQGKIDEYITYLSVITAIGSFNDKKE